MKRIVGLVLVVALCFSGTTVSAAPAKPLPPQSHAFGKSFDEWMKLYVAWLLAGSPAEQRERVYFMPLPHDSCDNGKPTVRCKGQATVHLKPGTPFAISPFGYIGERYNTGDPDDLPIDPTTFAKSSVSLTINGKTVINAKGRELLRYAFGPVYFDTPIAYDEPTDYGAVAAIFAQGTGILHQPLPKGTHTMVLRTHLLVPGAVDDLTIQTYKITVGK